MNDNQEPEDSRNRGFSPLLKFAALGNVTAAISNRVSKGDSVNAQDKEGMTALMYAAKKGNLESVALLLSLGANPRITNKDSHTAAYFAEIAGFSEVAEVLNAAKLVDSTPNQDESETIDLTGWVEDSEVTLPKHDFEVELQAQNIQSKIHIHKPIDRDQEWSDIEIDLPGILWRRRKDQLSASDKALVKEAIYLGYANGSIPLSLLEEIAFDEHEEIDEILLDALILTFEDLNLKIQDSLCAEEKIFPYEYDDYLESIYEQVIYCIDNNLHDDAWFYRSLSSQHGSDELLTHEQEIELGKKIDTSYDECIWAISKNETALKIVLEDLKKILSGSLDRDEMLSEGVQTLSDGDQFQIPLDDCEDEDANLISSFDPEITECIRVLQSDRNTRTLTQIQECLVRLNIDFKYIQKLIFDGLVQDSILAECVGSSLEARNKLVTSNLRLVSHVARAYRYSDLPFADLVQEGFIGLIKAAERYEYKKGFRFTTYATWWIRQAVSRMVQDKSRAIRLPVHVGELQNKIDRIDREIQDIPLSQRDALISQKIGISELRVKKARSAIFTMVSIDSEDAGDIALLESYDYPSFNEEDKLSNWMLRRSFESIFSGMNPKEVRIIKRRFGWHDETPLTLDEIGEIYGVTRERIRQIEAKAFSNLRRPSALRCLGLFANKKNIGSINAT